MTTILILNGPNLNLLGTREPATYGTETLTDINRRLEKMAMSAGCALQCTQSNAEHILIERIHQAQVDEVAFIIFNPAAFTHTSIALRDALLAVDIPFIEIHLSNIYARETYRQRSYFSDIAQAVISGMGHYTYELAIKAALYSLGTRP